MDIKLSVALVTRNRPDSLERALRSVWVQNVQPFEVVVSDDSNNDYADATKHVAETYQCRYIRGPQRGLYANRNNAALVCIGTHIRSMDDDHELPEQHIELCLQAIESDPEAVHIIGEHYPGEGDHSLPPICPGQLQPRGYSVPPKDYTQCWAIADGSTIFPQTVFSQDTGYAEDFRFGSAFYELGSRLFWLGYRIKFLGSTYVVHHSREFERAGQTVWSGSKQTALASRYFAMLCHSFIYQATLANKGLTCLQITAEVVQSCALSSSALSDALKAYKRQQNSVKRPRLISQCGSQSDSELPSP